MVAQGVGHPGLPLVVVSHPVGDRDENLVVMRGKEIANECVRVLTTGRDDLDREFRDKQFPLPAAVMPR